MKQRGIMEFMRVTTVASIIVIGISVGPILLGLPMGAKAKVAMQDVRQYSGPRASMAINANNTYLT